MREELPPSSTSCSCLRTSCAHNMEDIEELRVNNINNKDILKPSTNQMRKRSSNKYLLPDTERLRRIESATVVDAVAYCTCQQSRTYPYCDNTHKTFNKETNSALQPLIVALVENRAGVVDSSTQTPPADSFLEQADLFQQQQQQPTHAEISTNTEKHLPCTDEIDEPRVLQKKYKPSSIKDKVNRFNVITAEEVAEHCTRDSLWMIVKDNVYDITPYVSSHPGGERALLKFAGKDGTENVQFHSNKMLDILDSHYFIGRLYKEEKPSSCTIS